MSKTKKITANKHTSLNIKEPKNVINPTGYYNQHPSWCFSKCDTDKWAIHNIDFLKEFLPKLVSLEQRCWSDIISDKKHNHWIDCKDFSKEAQSRISQMPQSYDSLFSLRLSGKLRLFGVIENSVFYLIWTDPEHEVCVCNLKHT